MSVDGADRYLIAAGTEDYPNLGEGFRLRSVPREVETITAALTAAGYQVQLPELAHNPTKSDLEQKVGGWLTDQHRKATDVAVFYYSGHGDTVGSLQYLLTNDSAQDQYAFTAVRPDFFVEALGERPRARRLLLILDTCYSGQGAFNARDVASRLSKVQNLTGDYEGIWVVTASRSREEADQGVFAEAVARAVDEVQRDAGVLQRYLGLEAVVEQINKNLAAGGHRQRASWSPATLATGLAPFFPNREYQPDAPVGVDLETRARLTREITTHWAPKGRGIEVAAVSAGWYFTGRVTALRELVSWISNPDGDNRLRVVTADPGSGKSALLGRLVLLSFPDSRALASRGAPPGTIPPEGSVTVALLARGKTVERLKAELADQLGMPPGRDPIPDAVAHRPSPLIVIDALDEATNPQLVIDELITPLHEAAGTGAGLHEAAGTGAGIHEDAGTGAGPRLIVATRRHLLHLLPDGRVEIDLDDPAYLRSEDVTDYVTSVLLAADDPASPTPYRDHPVQARRVAEVVAAIAGHSFLIAQIAARILTRAKDMLTPERVRAEWHDWTDVGAAFDADLTRYGTNQTRVRELLTPLAWAQGNGLPRELWADTATALAGQPYTAADVAWVLTNAGAYIAEALEDDRSVYRLYHQEFTDHLRTQPPKEANALITQALLERVPIDPESKQRSWLAAHPYIRTHLATHAFAGGLLDDLVTDPGFLVAAAPERLLPALHSVTSPQAQLVASVYEAAAPTFDRRDPGRAAAQLQLAAKQQGVDDFADRIDLLPARRPWTVSWAAWQPEDRNLIIGRHTGWVNAVAVGRLDGRPIAVTGSDDYTVRVWDLATGQPVGEPLTGHTDRVNAVAVGQLDGRPIAVTGSDDYTVRVWDLTTGQPVGEPLTGHTDRVNAVAVGQLDGRPIAVTGSDDDTVRVWDLATRQPHGKPLVGHTGWVNAVAVGQLHGRPIAVTGSRDSTVRVWDLTTGQPHGEPLTGHTGSVSAVAVGQLHGHPIVVTGSHNNTVRVWDLTTGQPVGEPLVGHTGSVYAVAVGQLDGRPIAVTGSRDSTVRVWDLVSGQPLGKPLVGHTDSVYAVAISQLHGRPIAVTGSGDNTVRVLDLTTERPHGKPLAGHVLSVTAVAVGQLDGRPIAVTGSYDGTVRVWDLASGQPHGEPLVGHTGWVSAVAVGQLDGRPIAVTGGYDGTVRVWDLTTGQPHGKPLTGHTGSVSAVAISQLDGRPIAVTGSRDDTARVWDLTTGQPVGEPLVGHTDSVNAVAISQLDGRPIAVTGSSDDTVRVWDLATRQPLGEPLTGHTGGVKAMAISQLGGRPIAVTSGWDHTLRVWDLATGALSETIDVLADVACVATGPGRTIIVGTRRGLLALQLGEHQNSRPSGPNLPNPKQTQLPTVASRLKQLWQRLLGNS